MKPIVICLIVPFFFFTSCTLPPDVELTHQGYIQAWKKFYPSQAFAQGMHDAIFDYEDRSVESIQEWLEYNQSMLAQLSNYSGSSYSQEVINARLLKAQIQKELQLFEEEMPHLRSSSYYVNLIRRALNPILDAGFLTSADKAELVCQRLEAVQNLCVSAIFFLHEVKKEEVLKSVDILNKTKVFYEKELPEQLQEANIQPACNNFEDRAQSTAASIQKLIDDLQGSVLIDESPANPILGRDAYARQLDLYLDMPSSPEQLAELALKEIEEVRGLIGEVSREYLKNEYPGQAAPEGFDEAVRLAFTDMENDAPTSSTEYLAFWQELSNAAIQFIEDKKIATLPEYQTLRIIPAPVSAGPAARIGWVDSAPPFAPNPITTLYLPNIPDTLAEADRKDFWSSFNKPFNRMIVIHELFPGHYMQIKISRETPHPIRLLFPYGPYFEGWASFTEEVALDAGWEKERPLTYLAHLRKRLENANRAYTSVQVHCNGWDEKKVMDFSTQTSLLAPQFAKSLWGRLMRSPMQMTSYFYGGMQFRELFKAEKNRLGNQFDLLLFMDTIMKTGPVPIEEFHRIFKQMI